jgi:ribosomal protein L14E/L6E/L27E
MQKEVFVGSIVYSKAGRDCGKCYIIVRLGDNGYAFVANGAEKSVASPKRKNVKHLEPAGERNDVIGDKLLNGKQVFDSEIKSALRAYSGK